VAAVKLDPSVITGLKVSPGTPAALSGRDPAGWPLQRGGPSGKTSRRDLADQELEAFRTELAGAQELLYATGAYAVLVILQGLDAAGKDGTIKHVMAGVNPQGCTVVSFKEPTPVELAHDFLWRAATALPEAGRIGIFNRSYYEEVLVVRVHPELLEAERLPLRHGGQGRLWQHRYEDINAFEHHLHRNGVRIVKCFLHISAQEQRRRLLQRLEVPAKYWKFSEADLAERAHWDAYQQAYEEAITATSTPWAPWYVVPADHKHVMRALVGGVVVDTIDHLGLTLPAVSPDRLAQIEAARGRLMAEGEVADG